MEGIRSPWYSHWCKCSPSNPFKMTPESVTKAITAVMRSLGARGGRVTAQTMTAEERNARSRKGAEARWKKAREAKEKA